MSRSLSLKLKKTINVFALIFSLTAMQTSFGETIYSSDIPQLYPLKELKVFNLYGENALSLAKNCGLQLENHKQYWRPSLRQLEIIDRKVEAELKKNDLKLSKERFQRLYFGLSDNLSDKKVIVMIYPGPKEDITALFGMDKIDCIKISRKLIFDIQTMSLSLL